MFFRTPKIKISEMLLNVARDFIYMGKNIEEKQELLNCAVSAWNIACLKKENRNAAIKKYMDEYKRLNPTFTENDFKDTEENLQLLIKQKNKLYPDLHKQIISAEIREIDGKNHVTVASMKM
ncbi:MAG: hypothetical protein HZB37_03785 [Planctomycetes bacterium]|nr:hypothetical protein [Planctomycetota bacterium]